MSWNLRAGLALTVLIAASPLVSLMPSTGRSSADLVLGAGIALGAVLAVAWRFYQHALSRRAATVVILAAVLLAVGATAVGWSGGQVAGKVTASVVVGRALGRQVLERWWLLLFAAVILAADVWSVLFGPTRALVEEAPEVIGYLIVPLPSLGGDAGSTGLGVSDIVFLGLFTAGAAVTGLRERASYLTMSASLLIALGAAVASSRALPALPFLSSAFVLVNLDLFLGLRPRRRDPNRRA